METEDHKEICTESAVTGPIPILPVLLSYKFVGFTDRVCGGRAIKFTIVIVASILYIHLCFQFGITLGCSEILYVFVYLHVYLILSYCVHNNMPR
jgi:hypothetical protein